MLVTFFCSIQHRKGKVKFRAPFLRTMKRALPQRACLEVRLAHDIIGTDRVLVKDVEEKPPVLARPRDVERALIARRPLWVQGVTDHRRREDNLLTRNGAFVVEVNNNVRIATSPDPITALKTFCLVNDNGPGRGHPPAAAVVIPRGTGGPVYAVVANLKFRPFQERDSPFEGSNFITCGSIHRLRLCSLLLISHLFKRVCEKVRNDINNSPIVDY